MNLSLVFPKISSILLHHDDFSASLNDALRVLGTATNVDRVYLFSAKNTNDSVLINYDAEWCNVGVNPEINNPALNGVCLSDLGNLKKMFETEASIWGHVENCAIPEVKPLLEMQDIKSYLWVRLQYKGRFLGFVGFDSCIEKRDWNQGEVEILEYLTDMIVHSIVRKKAEDSMRELMTSLKKQNTFLKKVKDVHDSFLKQPSSKKPFRSILQYICEYCGASMGFITMIRLESTMKKVEFELMANTNEQPENDWTLGIENLMPLLVCVDDEKKVDWYNHKREVLLINKNEHYDDTFRIEGGISLENFLGLPIYYGSQFLGVMGLANFPSSVDKNSKEEMELAVDICANLLYSYQLKSKLRDNLAQERQLGKLRSLLIHTVSHEFRTPMSIIQSNVELLGMKIKGSKLSNVTVNIKRIENELDRMNGLIERVMMMEKTKHNMVNKSKELSSLLQVIDDVLKEYSSLIDFKPFRFVNRPKKEIWVNGNRENLYLIFSNMISNAHKYGGDNVNELEFIEKPGHITVIVRDYGLGISKDDIKHIFHPFHRGKNVINKPGTGLGLTIVSELLEQINGSIDVISEEGAFTEFQITLNRP